VTQWIDSFPWWAVALTSFAAGTLVGLVLRFARKGKYEAAGLDSPHAD
jgi:hypothetical protein